MTYMVWHLLGALGWVSNFGQRLIQLVVTYVPVAICVGLVGGVTSTALNQKRLSVAVCAIFCTTLGVLVDVYLLSVDAFSWRLTLLDSSRWLTHILPLHLLITVIFAFLLSMIRLPSILVKRRKR